MGRSVADSIAGPSAADLIIMKEIMQKAEREATDKEKRMEDDER